MDNDEDEDGNFTNWMSSYWGHGAERAPERAPERRSSFRRPSLPRVPRDRRASLPCQSQLNAMHLNPLRSATTAFLPTRTKSRDKADVKPHPRAYPASPEDGGRAKSPLLHSRIATIHELSETLERKLRFRSRNVVSLSDAEDTSLICHNEARSSGVGGRETHCSHRPHKEGKRPDWRLCGSASSAGADAMSVLCGGQRSRDVPSCVKREDYRQTHRNFSLRRQR